MPELVEPPERRHQEFTPWPTMFVPLSRTVGGQRTDRTTRRASSVSDRAEAIKPLFTPTG
jgi:hypothetical protein